MYADIDYAELEQEDNFYEIAFQTPRILGTEDQKEEAKAREPAADERARPQWFTIILAKMDMDQLIQRGQAQEVFSKCQIFGQEGVSELTHTHDNGLQQEEYEDYLQCLAGQHFLQIRKLDRLTLGDQQFDQLQYECIYSREMGADQIKKERDFDIILNSCKQRQDFSRCIQELRSQKQEEEKMIFEDQPKFSNAEEHPSRPSLASDTSS